MAQSAAAAAVPAQLVPPKLETASPVNLHVSGDRCYVYDVKDARRLRIDHHICGVLVGTLPQVAQQNVFLGLPLQLSAEEVACLLEHGLAVLVPSGSSHFSPSVEDAQACAQTRKERAAQYRIESAKAAAAKSDRMQKERSHEIAEKRSEKAKLRRMKAIEQDSAALDSSNDVQIVPVSTNDRLQEAADKTGYPIATSSTSENLPWYEPMDYYKTLEEADAYHVRIQPPSVRSEQYSASLWHARCTVFTDLWRKGYYLGSGLKFGGDFLAYPGDPLRFHSHFTVSVMRNSEDGVSPLDIVAWGRLATAVKKSHLIAAPSRDGPVNYITLEWAGFG